MGPGIAATTASRVRLVVLVALVATSSCGGREKPHASAPDASAPDASTQSDASAEVDGSFVTAFSWAATQLESWDASLDAAECDAEERCAVEVAPYYASRVDCIWRVPFEFYSRFFGDVSHYEALSRVFTLGSESARQACLDAVRSRSCSETVWPPACDAALVPFNPLGENEVCSLLNAFTPNVPCAAGLTCNRGKDSSCGVCAAPALLPLGGQCGSLDDCQSNFCEAKTHTCRPSSERRREGEPCSQSECVPNLTCVGPSASGVCTRYASEGEACASGFSSSFPRCRGGLDCAGEDKMTAGHCVNMWLPDGATCRRGGTGQGCRAFCIFPRADAQEGTCAPTWPERRDFPCVAYVRGPGTDCPESHYPDVVQVDGSLPTSCMCHVRRADGSACNSDAECASRRCGGAGPEKKCASPATLYGRCRVDSDCSSGYCNPLASWCDNPKYLCPPRVVGHDGG